VGVSACGLLLTACGNGNESGGEPAATVTETVTETAGEPTGSPTESPSDTEASEDDDNAGAGPAAALPPRPRRDECVDVKPPRDGRYVVYDAGEAVVRRDGGTLRVGNVNAARGWRQRVSDRDEDEVEITFRPRRRGAE